MSVCVCVYTHVRKGRYVCGLVRSDWREEKWDIQGIRISNRFGVLFLTAFSWSGVALLAVFSHEPLEVGPDT